MFHGFNNLSVQYHLPSFFSCLEQSFIMGTGCWMFPSPWHVLAQYKTGCVGDHLECIILTVKALFDCEWVSVAVEFWGACSHSPFQIYLYLIQSLWGYEHLQYISIVYCPLFFVHKLSHWWGSVVCYERSFLDKFQQN